MLIFIMAAVKPLFDNAKYLRNKTTSTEGLWFPIDDEETIEFKISSSDTKAFQKAFSAEVLDAQKKQGSRKRGGKEIDYVGIRQQLVAERLVHGWRYKGIALDEDGNEIVDKETGQPEIVYSVGFPVGKAFYNSDGSVKRDEEGNPILEDSIIEACTPRNIMLVFELYPDFYTRVDEWASDTEKFGILNVEDTKS